MGQNVQGRVEHLFRDQAGRMVAALTRIFGPENIDLAEDVVQEALLKALRQWPFHGIPEKPGAWLLKVARHQAIDILRRRKILEQKIETLAGWGEPASDPATRFDDELGDDRLALVFTCCHPAIPRASRVALTLKTVGGFGVSEIARNFLTQEATISQRLVRAKRIIREEGVSFEVPGPAELPRRLDSVLDVLYLLFNEGYAAHQGEQLVRPELVEEAIRLTQLLARHPVTGIPRTRALLALLLLQGARLPARTDARGRLIVLAEQDRSLWDQEMIRAGFRHFRASIEGSDLSVFHVQASIAAYHAGAPSAEETNWRGILCEYDRLLTQNPSPIVRLNRAVALAQVEGAERGLEALDPLAGDATLEHYYLCPATRGEFLRRLGRTEDAVREFRRARDLAGSEPERAFLDRRIRDCEAAE